MIDPSSIQFEIFWRKKIAEEVKGLIDQSPGINAYGIYLAIKNGYTHDKK